MRAVAGNIIRDVFRRFKVFLLLASNYRKYLEV